jgi:energy-coupling factor transport system ATP-binding protein
VTTTPFIQVRDLRFTYPRAPRPALDAVNVNFNSGELTAIVGANGAGKSTLARHLVGILRPPIGAVNLRGRELATMQPPDVARQVGYVFQYPEHQFVGGSVLDDVAFGLRRAGLREYEASGRAAAMLEEFGLQSLAQAQPFSLSHGEQRRLSVAAMLVLGQLGLFLDEPTFGQDRRNADLVLDKLAALTADDHAIVAITHDMRLVAERSNRVIAMSEGHVLFDGAPRDLFGDAVLLRDARLRPPPITQVGQRMRVPVPWLCIRDALAAVQLAVGAAS